MLQAVYVTTDLEEAEALRVRWDRQLPGVPLVIVESPYRALVNPVVTYLDVLDHAWPPGKEAPTTIVVLPEYVARRWWDRLLYNQAAKRLKAALVGREHTVIADVPYRRTRAQPRVANPHRASARGRPEHAHDRWTATHQGPQARRSPRPRRAAALGLLPLHGPQPARREARGRRSPRTALGRGGSALEVVAHRPPAGERGGDRRAAVEAARPPDLQLRRDLVVRLRDGGDPAGPRRGRRARVRRSAIQVAAAIAFLLAVVAISYRQVCRAFPNGGGAYAVARQELTPLLGLVAAAALLIDYVMTVAVSTVVGGGAAHLDRPGPQLGPDRDRARRRSR